MGGRVWVCVERGGRVRWVCVGIFKVWAGCGVVKCEGVAGVCGVCVGGVWGNGVWVWSVG